MGRQEHEDHERPDGVGGGGDDEGPVIRHAFSGEDCGGHECSDDVAHVLVAGPVANKEILSGECCAVLRGSTRLLRSGVLREW